MKKSILFLRSNKWGFGADSDLVEQETACRRYAKENGLTVVKVFEQSPWNSIRVDLFAAALKYVQKHPSIESILICRWSNLDDYKDRWIHKVAEFRKAGVRVIFVINQSTKEKV